MTHSFGRRGRSIDSGLLLYSGGRSRITVLMGPGLVSFCRIAWQSVEILKFREEER